MRTNGILLIIIAVGTSALAFLPAPQAPAPARAPRPGATAPAAATTTKNSQPEYDLTVSPADMVVLRVDLHTPSSPAIAELTLRNSSPAKAYKVTSSLTEFGFTKGAEAVKTDAAMEVTGGVADLNPGDGVRVVLRWKRAPVDPGTYQGTLLVKEESPASAKLPASAAEKPAKPAKPPNVLVRSTIQVIVSEETGAIQPLVSKLNLRVYRTFPFIGDWYKPVCFGYGIPLRATVDPNVQGITDHPRLGSLSRDFAGVVSVSWKKDAESLKRSDPVLNLEIGPIPFAGKYDGTLNFGNDAASNVQVTLNASDLVVYPLAWLAVCIIIATLAKRWIGGGRQLTQWRATIVTAERDMNAASEKFVSAVSGAAKYYSMRAAFADQCLTLWTKLQSLQGNLLSTLDTTSPDYQFVNTAMPNLIDIPKSWLAFGQTLNDLTATLETLSPSGPPPLGFVSVPRLKDTINGLLSPKEMSLTDFATLKEGVRVATTFIPQWDRAWAHVSAIYNELPSLKATEYGIKHSDDVKAVDDQLNQTRAQLWTVTGIDGVANKAAIDAVDSLDIAYSKLREAAKFLGAKVMWISEDVFPEPLSRTETLSFPPADLIAAVNELQAKARATDLGLGLLSLVLATLSGLNLYYFGKPFGTVYDYASLTLWAFGTKVAVDALSGGLERLFVNNPGR